MGILVVDASALVDYILRTDRSAPLEAIITHPDHQMHVPALCDVEVASALRRALLSQSVVERRAVQAMLHYLDLPLTRHRHQPLMGRILALRKNFSAYDATYVALAERLNGELLTGDAGLARAVRAQTAVVVVTA